jgi:hypothetical protein
MHARFQAKDHTLAYSFGPVNRVRGQADMKGCVCALAKLNFAGSGSRAAMKQRQCFSWPVHSVINREATGPTYTTTGTPQRY